MSATYRSPRLLAAADRLDGFECRSEEQTIWLRKHARQAHARGGTSRVFVVTEVGGCDVVAYYAWCMASIKAAEAPPRLRQGAGRYPQPVALLARLGVHQRHQARGLGAALLADVISRTAQIGTEVGCRGLLGHAESAAARAFYLHLIPEFEPSPTDPLHLVLLMKDILRTLR
ncbi:MAG: GNAT family N-acetyltransferase [Cyanobacteria bacterium J06638_7]